MIALLLTIVPMVFYSMGVSFPVRNLVNTILTPLQKGFDYVTDAIDGYASYFYRFDELIEENIELKNEVVELQKQLYDNAELEKLYAWLSGFLDLKMRHSDFEFLAASVTGRESGNYSKVITLDVGSRAGIKLNMPIITEDGVVGYISEVGLNWSKVTTVVEANSSIGAFIERTGDAGIAKGSFEQAAEGKFMLRYLPEDSVPVVGDRVLSSGYGSVYPRGLVIGYVESVVQNPYTRALDVTVKSRVDFVDLERVMVIVDFDVTVTEPEEVLSEAAE